MVVRLVWLLTILGMLVLPFSTKPPVFAANPDSVRDVLSDSRKSTVSEHTITVDMTAGTSFATGESFIITFSAGFTVPAFAPGDVSLDDGTARTILASCAAGANNVSLGVSGQVVTFTACVGFSASAAGAVVTIRLGTGSTKVTNPSTAGIKAVTLSGSYGDDPRTVSVAIIESVTVSLTIPAPNGDVRFTGDAFPNALVTILDGGSVVGTTNANSTSFFDKTIQALSPGTHTFSIFGQALDGRKTLTISFNINVISGSTITVSGILLPPIISVPAQEKRPAPFPQSGLARHNSTVTTFTNSHNQISHQVGTNGAGEWNLSLTDILHLGGHNASALVNDGSGNQSVLSASQAFEILLSADLSLDNLVNLTDFSILMFSYGLVTPPNKAADINDSGSAPDLVDFSVMMFYWTGG